MIAGIHLNKWTAIFMRVIAVAALCLAPPMSSADRIYAIVDGSLNSLCTFDFKVYIEDLEGVLLFIIDTSSNQFEMSVKPSLDKGIRFIIRFKLLLQEVYVRELCGCADCRGMMIRFRIVIHYSKISMTCQRQSFQSKTMAMTKFDLKDHEVLIMVALPKLLSKQKGRMYITMGNIGPYEDENGTMVPPTKQQMIGCVEDFLINSRPISFKQEGNFVGSSCQRRCVNDICNGGVCKERYNQGVSCDCRMTALNGPYCKSGLKRYHQGANTTYEKIPGTREVYLKMTWRTLLSKKYCLMDLVLRGGRKTISTNGSHVVLDSDVVSEASVEGVNFISVNISEDVLTVTCRNMTKKVAIVSGTLRVINIGFSNSLNDCQIFDGVYDLHFEPSKLRSLTHLSTMKVTSSNIVDVDKRDFMKQTILISVISGGSVLIFTIIVIVIYLRSRRELTTQIERVTANSLFSLDQHSYVVPETGLYGKIRDNSDYECIEDETGVYGTVDG